jgi:hypothetical protein
MLDRATARLGAEAKHTIRWRDLPAMPMRAGWRRSSSACLTAPPGRPWACNAMMVERMSRDDWMRALPVLASACAVLFATMGAISDGATRDALNVARPLHTHLAS